jgi:hypothetical protein
MPHAWDDHIHENRSLNFTPRIHHNPSQRKSLRTAEKYLRESTRSSSHIHLSIIPSLHYLTVDRYIHPELYAEEDALHREESEAWLREIAASEAKVPAKPPHRARALM